MDKRASNWIHLKHQGNYVETSGIRWARRFFVESCFPDVGR